MRIPTAVALFRSSTASFCLALPFFTMDFCMAWKRLSTCTRLPGQPTVNRQAMSRLEMDGCEHVGPCVWVIVWVSDGKRLSERERVGQ